MVVLQNESGGVRGEADVKNWHVELAILCEW